MTHLKIEQNTTGIEEVSHSIIEKLYNLAISGDLDASSNLQGRLHTSATYRSYIDYLTTNYPNLYITSSDYYVNFADPEVRRIFAQSNYGDGFGLLLPTAQTITNLNNVTISGTGNQFKNNTTIEHFDELGQFTSITTIPQECFKNCTNLTEIALPSTLTAINYGAFDNCSSLTEVVLPSTCTTIGDYAFRGCSNLTSINLDEVTTIEYSGGMQTCEAFNGCSSLQTIIAPQLQAISGVVFANCTNLKIAIAKNLQYSQRSNGVFYNCSALKAVIFPSMCNSYQNGPGFNINGDAYHQEGILANATNVELIEYGDVSSIEKGGSGGGIKMISSLRALVLKGDTIPTLSEWASGDPITNWFANSSITIYVKDSLLSTYQSDTTWSEYYSANIKGLSQYNPADYLSSELLQIYNSAMNTSYSAS